MPAIWDAIWHQTNRFSNTPSTSTCQPKDPTFEKTGFLSIFTSHRKHYYNTYEVLSKERPPTSEELLIFWSNYDLSEIT
eukprot:UN20400